MAKAVFQLEPLTCPSCIKKIETALAKTNGITSSKVLFNAGKVKTEFDDHVITGKEIQEVIEKLGYPVKNAKIA